MAMNAVTF